MSLSPSSRMTPWVGRLIIANAVVLLLLMTVFTSPALLEDLQFAPAGALRRPWTFVSYMFVHANLLHLLGNMLMLFVFGAPVESRLGSRKFILYYLYCGIGAAVFSMGRPHCAWGLQQRLSRQRSRYSLSCGPGWLERRAA